MNAHDRKLAEVKERFTNVGVDLDQLAGESIEGLARALVRRRGKLVIRKTEPSWRNDPLAWVCWSAWRAVQDMNKWGYHASWGESRTSKLIMLGRPHTLVFERAIDDFIVVTKANRAWIEARMDAEARDLADKGETMPE